MALTNNLGLTVDLPQDSTDLPTQVNADNENFKKLDAWAGTVRPKAKAKSFTLTTDRWSAIDAQGPYTFAATVTVDQDTHIGAETLVELINDNAVAFATYGFAIAAVDGQVITLYSISKPADSITLRIEIGG